MLFLIYRSHLDDEVVATALLDRLMFRCEVINLTGVSHRHKNIIRAFNLISNWSPASNLGLHLDIKLQNNLNTRINEIGTKIAKILFLAGRIIF